MQGIIPLKWLFYGCTKYKDKESWYKFEVNLQTVTIFILSTYHLCACLSSVVPFHDEQFVCICRVIVFLAQNYLYTASRNVYTWECACVCVRVWDGQHCATRRKTHDWYLYTKYPKLLNAGGCVRVYFWMTKTHHANRFCPLHIYSHFKPLVKLMYYSS